MQHQFARLLAFASLSSHVLALSVPAPQAVQQNSVKNGGLNTEGVQTLDGMPLDAIPEGRSAVVQNAVVLPASTTSSWTATADSFEQGYPPSNAIDGDHNSFWHTPWDPQSVPLPHWIQIDMKQNYLVNSISYQPRQDGSSNGNIGGHQITFSTDGQNFGTPKCIGTWKDDNSTKTSIFEATNARYVRLTALTEAGARGPWSSVAELQIFTTNTPAPAFGGPLGGNSGAGEWSPTIDFPLVPVSAALEYNEGPNTGTILVWSSFAASTFFGTGAAGQTVTASFDATSQTVSQRIVTNTQHDMFCEGLSLDPTGRIISTGGNSAPKTSIFTPNAQAWSSAPDMNTPRGYHASVTLSNGNVFTIGGSWSGGEGNKNGELYSVSANTWTALSGCPVAPMLTNDAQGIYRADNHGWLFGWKQGWVFQAGPSKAMNWYNTNGNGAQQSAGTRASDTDSMCGNAVMYDAVAGKILTLGGATSYQGVNSTNNAHIITLGAQGATPIVDTINPMWYQRIFANGVVLPNGNVFITGGQVYGQPFSDDTSILRPEIWVKATGNFIRVAPQGIPRNYHSTAILLADGRVFSGGGGLCGTCSTNHYDGQVYSPNYIYNTDGSKATRPVITSVNGGTKATVAPGGTLTVQTTGQVSTWSMIRMSSTTHTVNTDQRRIPLTANQNGNTWTMQVPTDPGIAIPGPWMLFAMDQNDVPAKAVYLLVT